MSTDPITFHKVTGKVVTEDGIEVDLSMVDIIVGAFPYGSSVTARKAKPAPSWGVVLGGPIDQRSLDLYFGRGLGEHPKPPRPTWYGVDVRTTGDLAEVQRRSGCSNGVLAAIARQAGVRSSW